MTTFPPELPDPKGLSEAKRDKAVEQALVHGALAPHLLEYLPVVLRKDGVELTLFVSPDYIGAGTGERFLRTPLPAMSLQRVADAYGAVLPTARMVHIIYKSHAAVRIAFKGMSPKPGETRHSSRLWLESNNAVEDRRAGREGLLVGHKKYVVVGPTQMARPTKVAIFGAWGTDGKMIQDLNVTSHSLGYCDYSQCGRLVRPVVLLNGVEWALGDMFRHPTHRLLLTGESGPLSGVPRYPV